MSRWPPELGPDTPLHRRTFIARALLALLRRHNPAAADEALTTAERLGERGWLDPPPLIPGAALTRDQVAQRAGVDQAAVTMWASRGIRRAGVTVRLRAHGGLYDPDQVDDFLRLYYDRNATPAVTPPAGHTEESPCP